MHPYEFNDLPAEERLFLQYGAFLRQIAALLKAESITGTPNAFSMDCFKMMEDQFKSSIRNEIRRAYCEGRDEGRRDERDECRRLDAALRKKDAAMGVLLSRLGAAGVDCSDLVS